MESRVSWVSRTRLLMFGVMMCVAEVVWVGVCCVCVVSRFVCVVRFVQIVCIICVCSYSTESTASLFVHLVSVVS